jgi:purine-binding chemotaxis protein CheW
MNAHASETFFIFAHGGLQYALPVTQVVEIVEMPALLPFHGALPGCLGNVSHREYLLPVFDPTALSSGRTTVLSKTFVVVRHDGAVFGLAMDRFVGVVALDALSESGGRAEANGAYVEKACAYRDNALVLLAVAAIVRLVKSHFTNQQLLAGAMGPAVPRDAVAQYEGRIFLCARIERVLFGIPVEHVIEIIEGYDVTPLFKVPPIVRGLLNLRGQVLACLDISVELGLPPRQLEERNQFVILKEESAELALCVDKVTGIRRLAPEKFQKADMVLSGEMTRFAAGMHEGEDGTLFVLAVSAVFDAPSLQPYRRSEG